MRRTTVLIAAFAVLTATPGVALAKAKVVFKSGQEIEADSIAEATWRKVKYRVFGSMQEEDASKIKDVFPDDRDLKDGITAYRAGKVGDAIRELDRASKGGSDLVKAFAFFFLGRSYKAVGQLSEAADAFSNLVKVSPDHFYAPQGTYEGAECFLALGKYKEASDLFSSLSKFGSDWEGRGAYGKAVAFLEQGKAADAERAFAGLARSASGETKALAEMGAARAKAKQGKGSGAKAEVERAIKKREQSPAVLGAAWLAMGDIHMEAGETKPALFAYMRSALLYGGESSVSAAKAGASAACDKLGGGFAGVKGRILGAGGESYTGSKPEAEFVLELMRKISAGLAEEVANEALKTAAGDEKADLEFLRADALRGQGKKDEFEKLVAELQEKYPNHPRSQDVQLDIALTNMVELGSKVSTIKDEADPAKREALRKDIQGAYDKLIGTLKKQLDAANENLKDLADLEDFRDKYKPENIQRLRRRDFIRLRHAEAVYASSKAWEKGSDEFKKRLADAYTLIDDFALDCEQFSFDYLVNAYKTKGLVLLDQEQYEEAQWEFESLKEYIIPIPSPTPEMKEFEKSVKISGYRLFAKCCVKTGQFEKAIEAFRALEEKFPNYHTTREGLLAMFELSKCYAGAGQTSEAVDKIFALVKNPESVTIEGISPEALRVEATKALAGISEAASGEIFPPEVQFAVGDGFKALGDDELAIVGYKGVLTSASTREERETWVPKAVLEMATLLYYQQRYLEAVLAYRVLFREFPNHPKAVDAIKYARTAIGDAMKVYGESEANRGPIYNLKKELDDALKNSAAGGLTAVTLILKEAAGLQGEGRYLPAAEKYLEVEETTVVTDPQTKEKSTVEVPSYPSALANAGYCYFKAWEEDKAKTELLQKAEAQFAQAIKVAEAKDNITAMALASYYLGEMFNTKGNDAMEKAKEADESTASGLKAQAKEDFKKAATALEPFDGRFAEVKKFRVRARRQQVAAYLQLDKPDEAVKRYDSVKDSDEVYVTIMALDLADWFFRRAGALVEAKASQDEIQAVRAKAATYASTWVSRSKDLSRSALFWAAAVITDGGKGAEAITVYEQLLSKYPRPKVEDGLVGRKAQQQTAMQDNYDLAQLNLARAYLTAGELEKAEKLFSELAKLVVLVKDENIVARGSLVSEERKQVNGPGGRPIRTKVFTVDIDGSQKDYMVPPRQREPTVVEGTDASKTFGSSDLLTLRQRFKSNFLVLDGLAEASWGLYQKTRDKNYLVNDVQEAWNRYYYFMFKGLDEGSYAETASYYNIPEKNYYEKLMQVAYRLLEISFERQDYKKVVSEVDTFETMGMFKGISPALIEKFKSLQTTAKSK